MNLPKAFYLQEKMNNKKLFAISGFLFFGPILYFMLDTNDYNLDANDKNFIKNYIRLSFVNWSVIVFLLIIYLLRVFGIFNLPVDSDYFFVWLCIRLTLGFAMILLDKTILDVKSINADLIISKRKYLVPIYNFYIWYKNYNTQKDNLILKESILFWSVFVLLHIFWVKFALWIILTILFVRIIIEKYSDIYFEFYKKIIWQIFLVNIEEVRCYTIGTAKFLILKYANANIIKTVTNRIWKLIKSGWNPLFEQSPNSDMAEITIKKSILSCQKKNIQLYDFEINYKNLVLILQYIGFVWIIIRNIKNNIYYQWIRLYVDKVSIFFYLLVLWRFGVMIFFKRFPLIPVFHEISVIIGFGVDYIIQKLKSLKKS